MTLDELFYGKDYASKNAGFKAELKRIEEKYADYFHAKPSRITGQPHDRLHNHYVKRVEGDQVGFGFIDGSDLDPMIKEECGAAFLKWFHNRKTVPFIG
jgi:hypothetical protein